MRIVLFKISFVFFSEFRFKLNDEWIPMDSSRLRVPVEKSPIEFKPGDRCLARWTDSRKFPATVVRPLENSKYQQNFIFSFI